MARHRIGFWSATAIGVGGMVGGGIFAVLGLAAGLGRGGTPVAFLLAGLVALLTAYSYARLSVRYPSEGGTVEFLNQAFGTGTLTGGLNVLLFLSYVVMLSLYASALGSYGAAFLPAAYQAIGRHVLITLSVLLLTGVNALEAAIVGRLEKLIVGFKLAILALFVVVGLWSVRFARLAPASWSSPVQLVAGGMIIFLAYEGFELIANTAKDVRDPRKTLPRAYYASVLSVILLYVLIAAITVGTLGPAAIAAAKDYALAVVAQGFLGHAGFILIGIAAILSTASAINATLYGACRISYTIAKDGELPADLERKIWHQPIEGLLISAAITLVVANLFDISRISLMGSAGFLLIFAAVNWANARLAPETGSRRWLAIAGATLCVAAFGALAWYVLRTDPVEIAFLVALVACAFGFEAAYRTFRRREIVACIPGDLACERLARAQLTASRGKR